MDPEIEYIKAFNNGYMLALYESLLLNTISKNLAPTNNYLQGFFDGKEQLELENSKDHLIEIGKLRSQSHTNYKEL
jgi:hypothetical protein